MKAQEMIVKTLELKMATRVEIANLLGVHPDTVSGFKTGKKVITEKMEETITSTLSKTYPQIFQETSLVVAETEEVLPEVEKPVESEDEDGIDAVVNQRTEKETTDVAALSYLLNVKQGKIRRVLRKLFPNIHERGKEWDLSKLTSEESLKLSEALGKK